MRLSDVVFEKSFRDNPVSMAISDADTHRLIDVNAAFLEKLGYASGEVLGKTAAELAIIADVERWSSRIEVLRRNGTFRNHMGVVIRRDGSRSTVSFSEKRSPKGIGNTSSRS